MKPDEQVDSPSETDPYATRAPSPESLELMAMAEPSAPEAEVRVCGVSLAEFERGLVECGFLDAGRVRAALAGLTGEDQQVDAEGLARHLVRSGKLTRYQAAALFQGKGRALLIGPYVVLDKLGSGGMGMVFKARARRGGPEIALKLLPPSASKHPHAVLRFRREAEIMARMDQPNVVAMHEIGAYGGVHYLVMDYVEGRDLDRIVRSGGPMKVARAVDCVIQAARGLLAAHGQGIVHRDIKPANLLLDSEGIVRVLDLGLARVIRGDDSGRGPVAGPSLTQSGIIMGTVDFLPPEQSDDSKRADHRADIYSLGCTLYFLLTGKPPYSGDTIMQKLVAHHQKPIPSLVEARPEVPGQVDAVFRAMLAKAPEDRPQSMAEVIDRLEACRGSLVAARSLRVFNDQETSKPTLTGLKGEGPVQGPSSDRSRPEQLESYDLMTFVRSALFDPDSGEATASPSPSPLLARPRSRRSRRSWDELGARGLVALAAIVVLIRFFPEIPSDSTSPVSKSLKLPEPAVVRPRTSEVAKVVEAPRPKLEPASSSRPNVGPFEPELPGPPPRSLLEDLLGPPPRGPFEPVPPTSDSRPPRAGRAVTKKDGRPPNPNTKARPPRPGDRPPAPDRPATIPDLGRIPF